MSASRSYSPPLDPILRRLPLEVGRTFPARKIRSAWVRFLPGHWALGLWKIGVGAVPLLRLPFPNQRPEAVFRRRSAQCAPAGRSGTGPRRMGPALYPRRGGCPHPPAVGTPPPVGAAISRPQSFPLGGGRTIPPIRGKCPEGTKGGGGPKGRMRVSFGTRPRRRQGVCPSRPASGAALPRRVDGAPNPRNG